MKLDKDKQKIAEEWVKEHWTGSRQCPVCGNSNWNISNLIFEIREFNKGSIVLDKSQKIQPFITVSCRNCGNTIFLNAIKMGLIGKKDNK